MFLCRHVVSAAQNMYMRLYMISYWPALPAHPNLPVILLTLVNLPINFHCFCINLTSYISIFSLLTDNGYILLMCQRGNVSVRVLLSLISKLRFCISGFVPFSKVSFRNDIWGDGVKAYFTLIVIVIFKDVEQHYS